MLFMNGSQQRNFEAVVAGLQSIGFRGDLLRQDYKFHDWFQPDRPIRLADAAAFGQTPVSYDNACFVVLIADGNRGPSLISQHRSLGAPRAFEIRDDRILHWKVTTSPSERDVQETFEPQAVKAAIISHKDDWSPQSVLRAKNIAAPGPRQLDFIDLGLIPALEQHIRDKLGPLLQKIFHAAKNEYKRRLRVESPWDELCRLVFRVLAGKIMFDRGVPGFRSFSGVPDAEDLLARVEGHYRDPKPVTSDPHVRSLVVQAMWESVSFENLSVEVLSSIWENTLVSDELRKKLSIHATPPNIARYVVNHLPIENIPQEERRIVEPCCGSGTFLVAALQRLRELLPSDMDARQRHRYFVQRLVGFDIEAFGLEVARSSLMLADFPNPNGWVLEEEDVFESPEKTPNFSAALPAATVVLCNPPFGDFNEKERQRYRPRSVHKPAELLLKVLHMLPQDAVVGFILPHVFVDGKGYVIVRDAIARRFDRIELVSLPGGVFEYAQHETAILLAQTPRKNGSLVSILHRKVSGTGAVCFLQSYEPAAEGRARLLIQETARSMAVPDLSEVWAYLSKKPTIADATGDAVHKGIEWNIAKRQNRESLIRETIKNGYVPGLADLPSNPYSYQCPQVLFLNTRKEHRRRHAFDLPWEQPKVIMNAGRISIGPWKIAAFADSSGLVCYETFICLWPNDEWDTRALSAVLNGPVANAFVHCHNQDRKLRTSIIKRIPIPQIERTMQGRIVELVGGYRRMVNANQPNPLAVRSAARQALRKIDAEVLRCYDLPPRLERQLLDYFRGHKRPVPFEFGDYYPADFKPYIPLWMYDSEKFRNSTAQRFMDEFPKINDPDVAEALADL